MCVLACLSVWIYSGVHLRTCWCALALLVETYMLVPTCLKRRQGKQTETATQAEQLYSDRKWDWDNRFKQLTHMRFFLPACCCVILCRQTCVPLPLATIPKVISHFNVCWNKWNISILQPNGKLKKATFSSGSVCVRFFFVFYVLVTVFDLMATALHVQTTPCSLTC